MGSSTTRSRKIATAVPAAALLATATLAAAAEPLPFHARLSRAQDNALVAQALRGAARRLRDPECRAVLSDFADASGRTLLEALAAEGAEAADFLGHMYFYEGSEFHCRRRPLLAYTSPGSRAVFVCSARFREVSVRNSAAAEAAMIHEALHALGLRENPPTWQQITDGVLARCRH